MGDVTATVLLLAVAAPMCVAAAVFVVQTYRAFRTPGR